MRTILLRSATAIGGALDRFRTMESFVRVARSGSFTVAASQLGLSRALVSRHVSDLEARLGVRLISALDALAQPDRARAPPICGFCEQRVPRNRGERADDRAARAPSRLALLKVLAPKSFGTLHLSGRGASPSPRRSRACACRCCWRTRLIRGVLRFRRAWPRPGAVLLQHARREPDHRGYRRARLGRSSRRRPIWRAPAGRSGRPISPATPACCISTSRRTTPCGVSKDRRARRR